MLREDTQHCLATLPRNIATQQCPSKKVLIEDSIQKKVLKVKLPSAQI